MESIIEVDQTFHEIFTNWYRVKWFILWNVKATLTIPIVTSHTFKSTNWKIFLCSAVVRFPYRSIVLYLGSFLFSSVTRFSSLRSFRLIFLVVRFKKVLMKRRSWLTIEQMIYLMGSIWIPVMKNNSQINAWIWYVLRSNMNRKQ